jgi:hypothetical protein
MHRDLTSAGGLLHTIHTLIWCLLSNKSCTVITARIVISYHDELQSSLSCLNSGMDMLALTVKDLQAPTPLCTPLTRQMHRHTMTDLVLMKTNSSSLALQRHFHLRSVISPPTMSTC